MAISIDEIRGARNRIASYIRKTPYVGFDKLSRDLKKDIKLKCESLQHTGSFKIRGAANCILSQLPAAKKSGVVAASAGNHAQGVASICHVLGIQATIVMPTVTPAIKVQNTQSWGAKVELVGQVYDDSFEHAMGLSQSRGLLFIHPFRDPLVMAGQGTIGLELLEEPDFSSIEAIVCSVGGGGLISGIGSAIKASFPNIKIYGVAAEHAPATYKGFLQKKPVEEPVSYTLAEGVAAKRTDQFMIDHIRSVVDEMFVLSEESIANAIATLTEHGKLVVEGAGALPVAALMDGKIPEKRVTAILSGGNIDIPALSNVLQRGLVQQGRLVRLLIGIIDRPGGLNSITTVLAERGANILQVFHQRLNLHSPVGETEIEVDIETRGHEHTEEILLGLTQKGFRVQRLS